MTGVGSGQGVGSKGAAPQAVLAPRRIRSPLGRSGGNQISWGTRERGGSVPQAPAYSPT